ncbi:MAG: GntR family transcriptional regulator [Xanthobacteraceae bacterium]|nr:GntR family transcriptional regulator [Xanthobacteraceae bacterium]
MGNRKFRNLDVAGERFGIRADVAGAFFNSFGGRTSAIKTLPEQLAEKLVEQIIRGDFAPGQRLHEMRLAEQFQVSRGPVREALRLLEREGLVVMLSHRGASVARLTEKRLKDIFSVRSALMGICAEELAERQSEAILALLDDGTAKLFAASDRGDVGEYIVIVYQLSMYLAEASENGIARTILFSLGRQTLPLTRGVFEVEKHRKSWSKNWRNIVEGIRAGDTAAAKQAAHDLLSGIKAAAISALADLEREEKRAALKAGKQPEAPNKRISR